MEMIAKSKERFVIIYTCTVQFFTRLGEKNGKPKKNYVPLHLYSKGLHEDLYFYTWAFLFHEIRI